jgi:hypothetical protein
VKTVFSTTCASFTTRFLTDILLGGGRSDNSLEYKFAIIFYGSYFTQQVTGSIFSSNSKSFLVCPSLVFPSFVIPLPCFNFSNSRTIPNLNRVLIYFSHCCFFSLLLAPVMCHYFSSNPICKFCITNILNIKCVSSSQIYNVNKGNLNVSRYLIM